MKNSLKMMMAGLALIGILASMAGCSTDENPITPNKMSEIRKKEADERANFKPDMSGKPGG